MHDLSAISKEASINPLLEGKFVTPFWLALAQRGDSNALREFYTACLPTVTRLSARLLRNPQEIEDVVQSTFVAAFRALPKFRGESSVQTWVLRIAYNEAMSLLRKRKGQCYLSLEEMSAPEELIGTIERLALEQALARLSVEHRAILSLYYWEELSCEQMAQILNVSVSAVKMRLVRARESLRRLYEE